MNHTLPTMTSETKAFWDGCAQGGLKYQTCDRCGEVQVVPRTLCSSCHHTGLSWSESEGVGEIVSYTTVMRAPLPQFKEDVPYVIVLVDMAEGFRLMANVKGDTSHLAIGTSVRVGFSECSGVTFPHVEVVDE